MKCRAGIDEQVAVALEVEAVVAVAAVERAAARPDELASAQSAQVVGDEGLRLVDQARQLADAAVAGGQLAQELPTERMPRQLENEGRSFRPPATRYFS